MHTCTTCTCSIVYTHTCTLQVHQLHMHIIFDTVIIRTEPKGVSFEHNDTVVVTLYKQTINQKLNYINLSTRSMCIT